MASIQERVKRQVARTLGALDSLIDGKELSPDVKAELDDIRTGWLRLCPELRTAEEQIAARTGSYHPT